MEGSNPLEWHGQQGRSREGQLQQAPSLGKCLELQPDHNEQPILLKGLAHKTLWKQPQCKHLSKQGAVKGIDSICTDNCHCLIFSITSINLAPKHQCQHCERTEGLKNSIKEAPFITSLIYNISLPSQELQTVHSSLTVQILKTTRTGCRGEISGFSITKSINSVKQQT